MTSQLGWSHPEHTIELSPDEARDLIESSGFEVTALRGMWLCIDPDRGNVLRFDEIQGWGLWPLERRVAEAHARPNEAFSWWIEARKVSRAPDIARVAEAIHAIFRCAWPERVNRLLTLVGEPCVLEGRSWLRTSGKPGVLMYGPYMPLPTGEYTVRFDLRRGRPFSTDLAEVARVDVIAGNGLELAIVSIYANQFDPSGAISAPITFRLDAMTFGIQFRVIVTGTEPLMAHKAVELTCHTNPAFDAAFLDGSACYPEIVGHGGLKKPPRFIR